MSEASGYSNINTSPGANLNYRPANPKSLQNRVVLGGVGLQYKLFEKTNLYANYSQAFRPVLFSDLYAIGTTVNDIDPNLKNQFGYNADGGYRGKIKNYLNFDVGVFQLRYNNRVDTINGSNRSDYDSIALRSLGGNPNNLRTNVGDSLHRGVEAFVEFDPILYFFEKSVFGNISMFVSYAQIKATYIRWNAPTNTGLPDWDRIGNRVENAPDKIIRYGATYFYKSLFSLTYQVSKVSSIYTDATNTEYPTLNAQAGKIAGYSVSDASFTYNILENFGIRGGVNNLENKVYFTRRAGGLPGPGLIPAEGRTLFLGMVATF
ncbi:MAG: TonB-dependent receptor [Leptospiraceae bacterium]|nr:TonB-dependent receptor [Leptospiraceae bacterium]